MKTRLSSYKPILLLGLLATHSSFASDPPKTCSDYLVTTNVEPVLGRQLSVTRIAPTPESQGKTIANVREMFGDDPQVLLGIDTSNSDQPYLVVGESLFRTTHSTSREHTVWLFNAATKTSMPHNVTITTYHLGELEARNLPRGYFIRISGLSRKRIERLRAGISAQVRMGSSNESWNHVIRNLTEGLARNSDLRLACEDPRCDYRYDLLERAITGGFTLPGEDDALKTSFYLVDEDSLKKMIKSARRSKYAGVAGNVAIVGSFAVMAGCLLYSGYQALAICTGLPMLPMPF